MNVQEVVGYAGRVIEDIHRQARSYLKDNSGTEEVGSGELWEKISSDLESALAAFDKKELRDTPRFRWNPLRKTVGIIAKKASSDTSEYSWNPFCDSQESCQADLDKILDGVLAILGTCGAAGYRTRIRQLQAEIGASQNRIANYREQMLSASPEQSQNFVQTVIVSSREGLQDNIADETDRVAEKGHQIENLKAGFREHLQHIGITVSPETADSFLLPVEDHIVSMAAVISNIGGLTEQLQNLVDESKEAPAEAKRYYGIYVLLVFSVDRIQNHFIKTIDESFIPRLCEFQQEAVENIADARAQLSGGGPKEQLAANVAAGERTVDACRLMIDTLQSHKRTVLDENKKVRILAQAAVNTYRTVRLSNDVAELIGYCESAFGALRDLKLPPLRPFQSVQLNAELQSLSERLVNKS